MSEQFCGLVAFFLFPIEQLLLAEAMNSEETHQKRKRNSNNRPDPREQSLTSEKTSAGNSYIGHYSLLTFTPGNRRQS